MTSGSSTGNVDMVDPFDLLSGEVSKYQVSPTKKFLPKNSTNPFLDSDGNAKEKEMFLLDLSSSQGQPLSSSVSPRRKAAQSPHVNRMGKPRSKISSGNENDSQEMQLMKKTPRSGQREAISRRRFLGSLQQPVNTRLGKFVESLLNGDSHASYFQAYRKMLGLAEELSSAKWKVRHLTESNHLIQRRKEELQSDVATAKKKLSQLEATLQKQCDEQGVTRSDLKFAKRRIADAEQEANLAVGRVAKFETDLFESEKKRKVYFEELCSTKCENAKLLRKNEELEDGLREISKDRTSSMLKEAEQEAEIEALRRENQELRQSLSKMSEYSKPSTCGYLVYGKTPTSELQADRVDDLLKSELEVLREKYMSVQAEMKMCAVQVQQYREHCEKILASKELLQDEIQRFAILANQSKVEKESLMDQIELVKKNLREVQNERDQQKHEVKALRKDNRVLRDEVSELTLYKQMTENKNRSSEELEQITRLLREQNAQLLQEVERFKSRPFNSEPCVVPTYDKNISKELRELSQKLDDLVNSQHSKREQIESTRELSSPKYSRSYFVDLISLLERSGESPPFHTELPTLIVTNRSGRNSPVAGLLSAPSSPRRTLKPPLKNNDILYGSNRDISFTTHIPAVNRDERKKVINLDLSIESNSSQMTTEL